MRLTSPNKAAVGLLLSLGRAPGRAHRVKAGHFRADGVHRSGAGLPVTGTLAEGNGNAGLAKRPATDLLNFLARTGM
jgi:hypothetical protein